MKKTITDKQFGVIARASRTKMTGCKVGYVKVGFGSVVSPLADFFGCNLFYLNDYQSRLNETAARGTNSSRTFYVTKARFATFLKTYDPNGTRFADALKKAEKPAPVVIDIDTSKLGTFLEQKQYAESFKGKAITNTKHTGQFVRAILVTDEDTVNRSYDLSKSQRNLAKQLFAKQGFVYVCKFTCPHGWDYFVPAHPVYAEVKTGKLPVIIRGYTAIKKKDVVNFGCANLDTERLKAAREFLKALSAMPNKGNRKTRVFFGEGEFSLDTLNQLELE